MIVRELTADEQSACRTKATEKLGEILAPLADLPKEQLYDGLYKAFLNVAHVQNRCSEHFKGNDFIPTDDGHVQRSDGEIQNLQRATLKAKLVMQEIVREMSRLELARVNGTSLVFRACADKAGLDPDELIAQSGQPVVSNIILPEREPSAYN